MKKTLFLHIILLNFVAQAASSDTLLMGSAFSFTAIHKNSKLEQQAIHEAKQEVIRIEKLISSWDPNSETSRINKNAGIQPVKTSQELIRLIQRSKKISKLSQGKFDISFASIKLIWDFKKQYTELPDSSTVKKSVELIQWKNIITTDSTVYLKNKGMKIDFGAIGKGYAANKAKEVMKGLGIHNGVINAGGDLICWGSNQENKPWSIGIADPDDAKNILSWLDISNMAVVTSGNYEKFVTILGKKYCHIINPQTGWPTSGLKSVTVICKDAEIADAIATTVFVIGAKEGMQFINQLKGIEGFLIDNNNQIHYSTNIHLNTLSND